MVSGLAVTRVEEKRSVGCFIIVKLNLNDLVQLSSLVTYSRCCAKGIPCLLILLFR